MSVCLLVHANGTRERVTWDQREVATHLGGAVTFVGAVHDLHAVVVGLADVVDHQRNALAHTHPHLFFDDAVCGPIVFVGSDDAGDAMDVDVAALERVLEGGG